MIDDERELERPRRGGSRRSRGLPLAMAASAALLIGVVAGAVLGPWRAVNTATASAAPSVPPAGPVAVDARFGWLAFSEGSVRVYDELGRARTEALPPVSSAVTSPNGRYVALWWQGSGGRSTLRVLDGATQQVGPVLFQTGEVASSKGAMLAWADDSSAVVIATLSIRGAAQTTPYTIRTIDLAGTAQVVGTIDAASASPVGWSRTQHRIGMIVAGSPGAATSYVVMSESGAVTLRVDGPEVPISADQASRFLVSYRDCGGCRRAFVVHDFATHATLAEIPLTSNGGWGVLFRPGSNDVLVEQDSQDMNTMTFTLKLWPDLGRGTPRDIASLTLPQGPGATTNPTWSFRADGSALFLGKRNPDATWTGELFDVVTALHAPLTIRQPLAAVTLVSAGSAATPQSVSPSAAPTPPRTSRVAWPSTTASVSDALARFRAAGLNVDVQPTGSAGLVFGADRVEQFLLQGETIAIYTFPTAAASARVLDDAANSRLTVSYLRTPYYVQVANLLVVITTNDPNAAALAIDTLTRP
jgi:hypothetical protein